MRYSGIQPQYFPRLHYFARILNADTFMIRDDAQFVSKHRYPDGRIDKSYQAHTPIKQSFGTQLLAVPIKHEGLNPIAKTKISLDHDWVDTHLKTLQFSYSKAVNFASLYPEIEMILKQEHQSLADLNLATILWGILHLLGEENIKEKDLTIENIQAKLARSKTFRLKSIKRASESKALNEGLTANEKIIALCKETGANEDYCGGTGVAAYVDHDIFEKNGIKITVQDWHCQEYSQLFTKQVGFIPNLSIIDLLINTSPEEAAKIISG